MSADLKPGTVIWTAGIAIGVNWSHPKVELEKTSVASVGKKQVVLHDRLRAFGYSTRIEQEVAVAHLTRGAALMALRAVLERDLQGLEEQVAKKKAQLAVAEAASRTPWTAALNAEGT